MLISWISFQSSHLLEAHLCKDFCGIVARCYRGDHLNWVTLVFWKIFGKYLQNKVNTLIGRVQTLTPRSSTSCKADFVSAVPRPGTRLNFSLKVDFKTFQISFSGHFSQGHKTWNTCLSCRRVSWCPPTGWRRNLDQYPLQTWGGQERQKSYIVKCVFW